MTAALVSSLCDTLNAVIAVMEEESEILATRGPVGDIAELAQAKVRLVARMEQQIAELGRRDAAWMEHVAEPERQQLTAIYNDLHNACVVNSAILERQIELSSDMLAAVGMEIEKLTGRTANTYGRGGKMRRGGGKPPLSVNTRL